MPRRVASRRASPPAPSGYLQGVPELPQVGSGVFERDAEVKLALDDVLECVHPLLAVPLRAARERLTRLARVLRMNYERVTSVLAKFHFVHLQRIGTILVKQRTTNTYSIVLRNLKFSFKLLKSIF